MGKGTILRASNILTAGSQRRGTLPEGKEHEGEFFSLLFNKIETETDGNGKKWKQEIP